MVDEKLVRSERQRFEAEANLAQVDEQQQRRSRVAQIEERTAAAADSTSGSDQARFSARNDVVTARLRRPGRPDRANRPTARRDARIGSSHPEFCCGEARS